MLSGVFDRMAFMNTNYDLKMRITLFLLLLCLPFVILGQSIKGFVTNENNEPLVGASIYWQGASLGTTAGIHGEFEISTQPHLGNILIASYVGHDSDSVEIKQQRSVVFRLKEIRQLHEVVVTGHQAGIVISNITPVKTEVITQTELQKSACCDLAGCFETQSSVQAQTTNVITNAKELRILGLSGVYNQVLIDGFPLIQALTYTYGISGIPGTLVKDIHISKGANSVVQGFESISGQINVETKEPDQAEKLLLNLYVNSFAEKQLNANLALKKKKWSNLLAFHTAQPGNKIDRDQDGFLDLPRLRRYAIFNKLKYGRENDWGWSAKLGLRYLQEQRIGGQLSFNPDKDKGSHSVYGQTVDINQPEAWIKTAYRINDQHKLSLFTSSFYQEQLSYFGTVAYKARQTNFYANLEYEAVYLKKHILKTGVSYRYMDLSENIHFTDTSLSRTYAGDYIKEERIPGVFAENTMYFFEGRLTWIAGLRVDHHEQFGAMLTPRTLLKYDIAAQTSLRASIGKGWRTLNLFSENVGLMVSSRDVIIAGDLKPEQAINMGLNLTHKFDGNLFTGYFSADYYRTNFENQIFPDYDSDPTKAFVKNFSGPSVGNGFQAEINVKIRKRYELKTGYNFLDVYREINGSRQSLPFNSRHKVLATFSYTPLTAKFHFDMNLHWYGPRRLPDTRSNPIPFQRPDYSDAYTLVNAQFTYTFGKFEVYAGCENIFDFRQERPILSWEDPFGPYFDTSSVWGPVRGREIYGGVRFKMSAQ